MDASTIGTAIGGFVLSILAGVGSGRYFSRRFGGNTQPETSMAGTATTTDLELTSVKTLDIVTETECKDARSQIIGSFNQNADRMERAINRQTDQMNKLTQTVAKLEAKVDLLPVEIENANIKAAQKHETRYHGRPASGGHPKGVLKEQK